MGQARNWTPEEYEYLENSWGKVYSELKTENLDNARKLLGEKSFGQKFKEEN